MNNCSRWQRYDTLFIAGRTASGEVLLCRHRNYSLQISGREALYGGTSADSTTDGADTLNITNLYEATDNGADGADSFVVNNNIDSVRVEGGTDASIFTGDGDLN